MPLETKDDASIKSKLKLGFFKDFCAAAKAASEKDQIDRVREFRVKFNSLALRDSEEKDWMLTVTATIQHTKKNIPDSLDFAVELRKKLNDAVHDRLRFVITKLGAGAGTWISAFGPTVNLVLLDPILATLGSENANWVQSVPADRRTPDLIGTCLTKLQSVQFTKAEILNLWDQFKQLEVTILWALAENSPDLLHKAYKHVSMMLVDPSKTFWMWKKDRDQIDRLMAVVYKGNTWNIKPIEVNALASGLAAPPLKPWSKLFTIEQLD